jgi:hypothetical protein
MPEPRREPPRMSEKWWLVRAHHRTQSQPRSNSTHHTRMIDGEGGARYW